ncbi:MAG: DUF4886 domain-containing protein [Clostridia bacterium]|nr:DUF4886 domain-containing protein [Clostridia bacterium]
MIKVLSIGNSFSQDATRYLHGIAKSAGVDLKSVNLYIGGCPLSEHYINALENRPNYSLQFNGEGTGFYVSIKDALLSESWNGWDYITIQQVSHQSPFYDTYQPYLNFVAEYIRKYAPKTKLLIHQTWAYEQGSDRLTKELGYNDYHDMLKDIINSYNKACSDTNAYGIIPSGEAFDRLLDNGIEKVHRDTFHASLGLGRYTLGLVWYEVLTGNTTENVSFRDFDVPVTEEEIAIAKKSAHEAVMKYWDK